TIRDSSNARVPFYIDRVIIMSNDFIPTVIYVTTPKHTIKVWNDFVVKFKNDRYLISQDHDLIVNFVNPLLENEFIIQEQKVLSRARINNSLPYERFDNDELGSPPADKASPGRFNPKAVPYLYMANDVETAVSEVLPFISAKVDV